MTTIKVYDESGNRKVPVNVHVDDMIHYKRNGRVGFMTCVLCLDAGDKIKLQHVNSQSGYAGRPFWVPVSSRQFMAAFRQGERLT